MTKSRYRDGFLIGFSHPTASYFLLLRRKKVAKEKAARYRFLLALLGFVGGQQRGLPALLLTCGILAAPLRAVPDKTCGARRGKRVLNNVTA
ncbi:hypothetical protein [Methylovulum miyakonense]|uniref:hypothetical protein n=1 Tax=Methylovulum miyakonense TaxID=645578 RepID=UPI000379AAEB|nr:hypothetical protein [Methylovulum miyakonense]